MGWRDERGGGGEKEIQLHVGAWQPRASHWSLDAPSLGRARHLIMSRSLNAGLL